MATGKHPGWDGGALILRQSHQQSDPRRAPPAPPSLAIFFFIIIGLIFIAAISGRYVSDADTINQFAPYWLVASFAFAASQARKMPRTAAVTLIFCLGFGGWRLSQARVSSGEAGGGSPIVTLLSFNANKNNATPLSAARWIRSTNADVVVLLEAGSLPKLLRPSYPYQINCSSRAGRCSTYILSRRRPVAAYGLAVGDADNRKALSAARAIFTINGHPLDLVAVHLSRPWPFRHQDQDVAALLSSLEGVDRKPMVIAGDFNLTPWSFKLQHLGRQLGLVRITPGAPTWPADFPPLPPVLPIDQIFAGQCWRVVSLRTGPSSGSDHLPLLTTLSHDGCRRFS